MPDVKFRNANGKVYVMPWAKPNPPTDYEMDEFVRTQEVQPSTWDKLNAPTTTLPSRIAGYLSEKIAPTDPQKGKSTTGVRGVGSAFVESLGSVADSLTSPVNLAFSTLTGGAGLARGAVAKGIQRVAPVAKALTTTERLGSAGMGAAGVKDIIENPTNPGGYIQAGLGALGARNSFKGPKVIGPKSVEGIKINTPNDVTIDMRGAPTNPRLQAITEVGGKPIRPVESINGPKNVQELTNAQRIKEVIDSKLPAQPVTPQDRVLQTLSKVKTLRDKQEQMYSQERATRVSKAQGILDSDSTEEGYGKALGALKGELPQFHMAGIREKLSQEDIDSLFSTIKDNPTIRPFERIRAMGGLSKLLGSGGRIPQESEITLLNKVFGNEFVTNVKKVMPYNAKARREVSDYLNVPMSIKASMDFSFPMRQGILFSGNKEFRQAFKPMFESGWSEEEFQALNKSIKEDPFFKYAANEGKGRIKLAITDLEGVANREEGHLSNVAESIPLLGRGVRASGRAYTAFANKLRFDTMKTLVQSEEVRGNKVTPEQMSAINDYINTFTGRGKMPLKKLEQAAPAMNAALFSPRLLASRIRLLDPRLYYRLPKSARMHALKSVTKSGGIVGGAVAAAVTAGMNVELDPHSSDFLKIKVGDNTRIDLFGGMQQFAVLAARTLPDVLGGGYSKSIEDKITPYSGKFGARNRIDAIGTFLRNKESPLFAFAHNMIASKDSLGRPLDYGVHNPKDEAIFGNRQLEDLFMPMIASDFLELIHNDPEYSWLVVPGAFGVGVQTFNDDAYPRKRTYGVR